MEILIVCLMWRAGKDEDTQKKNPKWLEWLHKRGWFFFFERERDPKEKRASFCREGGIK